MQLFDPGRPTLASGRPCLLNTHRITGCPSFDIEPVSDGLVLVEVMLRYDNSNGFVWYTHECKTSDLSQLIIDYMSDPEKILKEKFNWDPSKIIHEIVPKARQNFAPTIKTAPRGRNLEPQEVEVEDLDI